jgi:hypothetical protein
LIESPRWTANTILAAVASINSVIVEVLSLSRWASQF